MLVTTNKRERLPVGVADDEAGVGLIDHLGRREAAGRHFGSRQKRINFPDRTKFVTYVRSHLLFNLVIQPDDLFSEGRECRVAFCATFEGSNCRFLQRLIWFPMW